MNRIVEHLRELGGRGQAALIVYLTAGDPPTPASPGGWRGRRGAASRGIGAGGR